MHAHLKSRSFIRCHGGSWKVIGLYQSIKIGDQLRLSGAFCPGNAPPELAKRLFCQKWSSQAIKKLLTTSNDLSPLLRKEWEQCLLVLSSLEASDRGEEDDEPKRPLSSSISVERERQVVGEGASSFNGLVVFNNATPAIDMWQLGLLIYYLCTGSPLIRMERTFARAYVHRGKHWETRLSTNSLHVFCSRVPCSARHRRQLEQRCGVASAGIAQGSG